MYRGTVFCLRRSEAIRYASRYLADLGIRVTDRAAQDATHLLLPVPSFSGGDEYLAHVLAELPEDVIVCGGNLHSPLLENYRCVDFLRDPRYLADNAAITAECAKEILRQNLTDISGKKILILGWGRIGKCLGFLLKDLGAEVAIGARKETDLAMLHALKFRPVPICYAREELERYDAIVNTVPELILPDINLREDAVLLELASRPGMTGKNIIDGRGLPGKMAPKQSGKLIGESFLRLALS